VLCRDWVRRLKFLNLKSGVQWDLSSVLTSLTLSNPTHSKQIATVNTLPKYNLEYSQPLDVNRRIEDSALEYKGQEMRVGVVL